MIKTVLRVGSGRTGECGKDSPATQGSPAEAHLSPRGSREWQGPLCPEVCCSAGCPVGWEDSLAWVSGTVSKGGSPSHVDLLLPRPTYLISCFLCGVVWDKVWNSLPGKGCHKKLQIVDVFTLGMNCKHRPSWGQSPSFSFHLKAEKGHILRRNHDLLWLVQWLKTSVFNTGWYPPILEIQWI